MAPKIAVKNKPKKIASKGFTILEAAVSILVFATIIGIGITSYINLLRASAISRNVYASLENLSLGLERIWKDVKYGSCFIAVDEGHSIQFKDMNGKQIELKLDSGVMKYIKENSEFALNDSLIAFVENVYFIVSSQNTSVTMSVLAKIKSKDFEAPINLQISVAPINAPFPSQPCE